jgi:hypothetical protein
MAGIKPRITIAGRYGCLSFSGSHYREFTCSSSATSRAFTTEPRGTASAVRPGGMSKAEISPDLVRLAKRLHRYPVGVVRCGKSRRLSRRRASSPPRASPMVLLPSPAWLLRQLRGDPTRSARHGPKCASSVADDKTAKFPAPPRDPHPLALHVAFLLIGIGRLMSRARRGVDMARGCQCAPSTTPISRPPMATTAAAPVWPSLQPPG